MPITFQPTTHVALQPVAYNFASHPGALIPTLIERNRSIGEIFQSSYARHGGASTGRSNATLVDLSKVHVAASDNGFVHAAVDAYNNHNHLVMSPDDVWTTILLQFNLFVNAHAEELRHVFVNHEGKKELTVTASGTRYSVDFGRMAEQMTTLIEQNVKDPELRTWIIPDFSTTTDNDRIVASIAMMATLKEYFSYQFSLLCGLPKVTLLGEKADWAKLLSKIDKLQSYGAETTQWHGLLKPVLTRFVSAFDDPSSKANNDFWQQIAHREGGGSGPRYISGWITAFCFFDKSGKSLYDKYMSRAADQQPVPGIGLARFYPSKDSRLQLDGVLYHAVDTGDIPPGYAEVDVKLNDNGQEFKTLMVAGHLAMKTSGEHKEIIEASSGWFIAEKKDSKPVEDSVEADAGQDIPV